MTNPSQDSLVQPKNPRHIGHINVVGLVTLIKREVDRFASVYMQTIVAPIVTTLLFYMIFALAFGGLERDVGGAPFLQFLAPGLIMMTMVQNAFANVSSSLIISKIQGNIVDILMPPLSPLELALGFLTGALVRGMAVGLAAGIVMSFFAPLAIHNLAVVIVFAFLGNMLLATLGLATGIWSDKFDHVATVTNFIVTPLTFLSGTFYSIRDLPDFWQGLALYNPFFYMIDGFRAGFTGQPDASLLIGGIVLLAINTLLLLLVYAMLRSGYKIKS